MDVGADLRVVRAPVTAVVSACSKLTLGFTRLGHGNAPQSFNQFLVNGCANCPFLKLIDDKERIRDCTSSSFTGFVRPSVRSPLRRTTMDVLADASRRTRDVAQNDRADGPAAKLGSALATDK